MTENPRPAILRIARQRTVAIALTALAGTGLLTAFIAHESAAATGTGSPGSTFQVPDLSGSAPARSDSGIGSPSTSGPADGGSHSS